jgi:predicted RNase H-like HicB family nuclease
MKDLPRYTMVIQWSDEDQAYLVSLPDWEGRVHNPVTHGDTYQEAVGNGLDAITALTASALKHGESLPEPSVVTTRNTAA